MDIQIDTSRSYTIQEVAEIFRVSRAWVYRRLSLGELEGFKAGSSTRIGGIKLVEFIDRSKYSPLENR